MYDEYEVPEESMGETSSEGITASEGSNEPIEDGILIDDSFEQAVLYEQAAMEEIDAEMAEHPLEEEDEGEEPERKLLKREMEALALARLEAAARTERDFENVIAWWDRLDANRERKERYHEVLRSGDDIPLDYGAEDGDFLSHVMDRQLRKGDFLDAIFFCPFEIHELVDLEYMIPVLKELKDEQKELLFQHFILKYSTLKIGCLRGQSDRNIRKVRNTLLKRVQKKLLVALQDEAYRQQLTLWEKNFLIRNGFSVDGGVS